jgi:hypothetical protein
MTQIHPEYIELAEIVEWAQVIVVAAPADPPHRTEVVSILPPGSEFEGKNDPPYHDGFEYDPETPPEGRLDRNYPPYSRFWRAFTVRDVLKGEAALAGTTIEARNANDGIHLGGHQSYYIQGIGESPIVETYEPAERPGATDTQILFLHTLSDGTGYEFVAEGAVETLAKRADVEALIAQG